jgi:predicted nucleotidyltransferase
VSAPALEEILLSFTRGGVDFVVIGGIAAIIHGSARATYDIDVCYDRSRENVERLCRVVGPWKPRLRGAPEGLPFAFDPPTVVAGLNFTLSTDVGDLDLLGELPGVGSWKEVVRRSMSVEIAGSSVQVLTIDALIDSKRAAGRKKDVEAVLELEALRDLSTGGSID